MPFTSLFFSSNNTFFKPCAKFKYQPGRLMVSAVYVIYTKGLAHREFQDLLNNLGA